MHLDGTQNHPTLRVSLPRGKSLVAMLLGGFWPKVRLLVRLQAIGSRESMVSLGVATCSPSLSIFYWSSTVQLAPWKFGMKVELTAKQTEPRHRSITAGHRFNSCIEGTKWVSWRVGCLEISWGRSWHPKNSPSLNLLIPKGPDNFRRKIAWWQGQKAWGHGHWVSLRGVPWRQKVLQSALSSQKTEVESFFPAKAQNVNRACCSNNFIMFIVFQGLGSSTLTVWKDVSDDVWLIQWWSDLRAKLVGGWL